MIKPILRTVTRSELEAAAAHLNAAGLPHIKLASPPELSLTLVRHSPDYFCLYLHEMPYDGRGDTVLAYTWYNKWQRHPVHYTQVEISLAD